LSDIANYLVARLGATVYIRSVGLANMKSAPMLDAFLQAEIEQKALVVCVDLSSCSGMDSTFMGILVGYSQVLGKDGGRLVVVNPTEQNLRLLNMLGVSAVLPVVAQTDPMEIAFVNLPASPTFSPMQRIELVRRAHQNLVALNDENQGKFSAFLTALDGDLAKLKAAKSG
jgi:anti-anti-sigma factor